MTAPAAVLIGPPGAGKSAVGPLLAELLRVSFRDTDTDVAEAGAETFGEQRPDRRFARAGRADEDRGRPRHEITRDLR